LEELNHPNKDRSYWEDIPYIHSKLGFICLDYPLGIFIIDEMGESA
jgi:hypothetical protein